MASDDPVLNSGVIDYLKNHASFINAVAAQLGVPAAAIAAAVAQEGSTITNTVSTPSGYIWRENVADRFLDHRVSTYSSDAIALDYTARFDNGDIPNGIAASTLAKPFTPTGDDVGIGNLNLGYSLDLLNTYINDPGRVGDPLNLLQYQDNYAQFAQDLIDTNSNLTFTIAALNIQKGQVDFTTQFGTDYTSLTDEQKAQLLVAYFKIGAPKEELVNLPRDGATLPTPADGTGAKFVSDNFTTINNLLSDSASLSPLEDVFESDVMDYQLGLDNLREAGSGTKIAPMSTEDSSKHADDIPPETSPLVINLNGMGLAATTSLTDGTMFDLKNTGFAEQTAWIGSGSGLLVYDPGGGAITNGSQLFGTSYSLSGGGYAIDGYQALANLDSNSDGVINSSDTAWSSLRVWVDGNGDGISDPDELETMADVGIASFSLTTTNTNTTDDNGNYVGKTSTYSLSGGGSGEVEDVWFQTDPTLTEPDTTVAVDDTISLLPNAQGSGTIASLQQAMQIQKNASDTTLAGYVGSFAAATDDATRNTLVDEIIYQWTGVQSVSPTSRGAYFDAQKLEALEAFNGQPWVDNTASSNPNAFEAGALTVAYQQLHDYVLAQLEAQTDLQTLFNDILLTNNASWNVYSQSAFDFSAAETEILSDLSANRATGLVTLTDFNQALHALGMDTDSGYATFRSDLAVDGADIAATFPGGTKYIYGTAGDDVITAWAGNQAVDASQGGNDTLIGMGDNVVIGGSGGSNLFIGGVGDNETFLGHNNATPAFGGVAGSSDTFIAGQGTETFAENWDGNVNIYYAAGDGDLTISNFNDQYYQDTLFLDSSISESDVSITPFGIGWHTLTDGVSGDTITLRNMATLQFSDGTSIILQSPTENFGGIDATSSGATVTGNGFDQIYSYDPGTGHVTLIDSGGKNSIWMGGTITAANVTLTNSGNDLLITDGVVGDQITDKNYAVQTLRFSDGSTLALSLPGSTYTLAGGTTSTGTGLNDTYTFTSGTGTATISDPGGKNTLVLGSGISSVSLSQSGNDLLITDGVGGDLIDILGQMSAPVVQTLIYPGVTLSLTGGLTLHEASGNSLLNGTTGNDTLFGYTGTQTINGNGGNDVFVNGAGNTTVNGGNGNDVYSYTSGSGNLVINDTGGNNTIVLGTGIATGDVSLTASGNDLLITDSVSGDTITIKDQLDASFIVGSLVFHSGTTETLEGLGDLVMPGGSTVLYGAVGNDTLTATAGTETLIGNGGDDVYVGASGTVSMVGNTYGGNDTFIAGTGKTTAYGGVGNDTYSYASGDGALVVNEGGGQNTLVLAAGLTAGSLTFTASGHDLLITDGVGGDTITLKNQLSDTDGVQTMEFSDTSTEKLEGIALTANSSLLYGTSGSDTLTATSGTETINGNGGNDIFIDAGGNLSAIGGNGNDTYSYISGSGLLTIVDSVGANTIKLGSGITTGNVSLTASGHDLLITDSVGGDTLTLKNQLTTGFGITSLVFSGGTTENLEGLALTANASILYGTPGNDTLTASSGTQTLTGNGGNDEFVGTGGVLTMIGASGNDLFIGGSGSQVMNGGGGHDVFEGSGGNDTMNGSLGTNSFIASTGTEKMNGGSNGDVFIAGGGTASATGGSGNDLYSYASGNAALIISDAAGTDTLKLASGLTSANVVLSESANGHDLLITDGTGGDLITIVNHIAIASSRVETLIYGDASTLNLTSGLTLKAQTGSSTLVGLTGNNTLIAVSGGATESLLGNTGNDTYSYSSGDAAVYISEGGNSGTDTLKMGSGLTASNVSLSMTNGVDLLIADGTGGDLITIHDQTSAAYAIEKLVYGDATSISLVNGIKISATSGTATVTGTTGNDTLTGTTGTQILNGDGGSDTFIGGTGTQTLNGGGGTDGNNIFIAGTGATSAKGASGNDTYSYASSDGALVISETGGTDTLKLASGLTSANVVFSESTNGHDLLITDGTGGDLITMVSDVSVSSSRIEKLIYGDGSTLDLTSGLTLTAQTGSSTLVAIGGNNTLLAVSGANTETLEGNTGNDLYSYASGTGKVYIFDQGGTDTLKFGTGLTAANVVYTESSNGADLLITDGVGGDTITLHNEVRATGNQIENFVYGDGSTANLSSIVLTAGAGNTTLNGTAGNNILVGTTGNQTINGQGGADFFNGGTGTQTLNGASNTGANIFFAGVGTTSARGGTGNDSYNYISGDGALIITESNGTDTIILGSGLTSANVSLTESTNGHDLLITDGTVGDQITITSQLTNAGSQVETLVYGDTSTASLVSNLTLIATSGSSTLNGLSGNDTLIAVSGANTETLQGGLGNDTYSYASGDGIVLINETGSASTADTVKLGSGLTSSNIVFSENGLDLLIIDGVSGDLLTIKDAVPSSILGYGVETLIYGDGTSISLTSGVTLTATTGNTTLNGIGFGGNNILIAVTGTTGDTETLLGSTGSDIYSYASGDGHVFVSEFNGSGGTDTVKLASGLTSSNVSMSETTNGHDLLILDGTSGDQIDIFDQYAGNVNYEVEKLIYGDGTSLSLTGGLTLYAQTGSSTLISFAGNNTFIAAAGGSTETLDGNTGNDTYSYASGDGAVLINEAGHGGTDALVLASGLTSSNVSLSETTNGHDLLITDGTGGDTIDIFDQFLGGSTYDVENMVYGDGTSLSLTGPLTIYAQTGSSTLVGYAGTANTFIAVAGGATETLLGNTGNDTYSYTAGDGAVYISEGNLGGTDTLKLASSMTASNVFFSEASNGADLLITDTTSGDLITIKNAVTTAGYKVETLVYSDGSTLDLTKVIGAGSAATTLNGTTGNDIMIPNTGNLTLAGKGGNDLYDFGRGMGKDVINNGVSTTNTANGTLFFGHGIGDNQLWFDEVNSGGTISPTGANLRIDIMGTTTSMTINGFFTGGSSTYDQLSEFELSDNGLKLDSQLANLVSAMATFETNYAAGHGGTAFDPTAVSSITDTTVLSAVSSDWH